MYFQTLDEKKECVAVFRDGDLFWNEIPKDLTKTWKYSAFLDDLPNVEYAHIYSGGKSLDEACPDDLRDKWSEVFNKLRAYHRSFFEAKINLNENCFYELVPEKFLIDYCKARNQITKYVLENCSKPDNYDFLVDVTKMLTDIRYQRLNIDTSPLNQRAHSLRVRDFLKKIKNLQPYINYNLFGSVTGRLTVEKGSFPILNLDKTYRSILKPNNDWFVELDYNAAELRTLLALSEKQQPTEDIHDWNMNVVYRGALDRDEAKKRVFAWLYNPNSNDFLSNRAYDRGKVKERYWDGKRVKNPYGREIESDEFHALNYILQSTTNDIILRQALKIHKMLKGRKSNIAFTMHDSIVLDFSEDDQHMVQDLYETFAKNDFGIFKTSAKAGKNFGDMKDLWIK